MPAVITSTANPVVQELKALLTGKGRREQNAFLLEGYKLIEEALQSGMVPDTVLYDHSMTAAFPGRWHIAHARELSVSGHVMRAVCDTQTPQGIAARFPLPAETLPERYEGLWVALEAVQDPGNAGAIIRTADAMGAAGVLLGKGCADAYSPKVVRAAMGSLFHLRAAAAGCLDRELARMKKQGYCLLAGDLRGESEMPGLPEKTAVLIGSEGGGLSAPILQLADVRYRIDMPGRAESLNAAAAGAIILYEVKKHRGR